VPRPEKRAGTSNPNRYDIGTRLERAIKPFQVPASQNYFVRPLDGKAMDTLQ